MSAMRSHGASSTPWGVGRPHRHKRGLPLVKDRQPVSQTARFGPVQAAFQPPRLFAQGLLGGFALLNFFLTYFLYVLA